MSKDNNNSLSSNRYTIIHYDLCSELCVGFEAMIILDTMFRFSKRNEYKKGVTFLHEYLCISRTTLYKYIKILGDQDHITEYRDGVFSLNSDLDAQFHFHKNKPISGYLKLYHQYRKDLKLSVVEGCLLNIFYTLSKKSTSRKTYAHCKFFTELLKINKRTYYDIKEKFKELKLIENENSLHVKLTQEIFDWFADQEKR